VSHTELAENKRISKTRQVIESSFAWIHSKQVPEKPIWCTRYVD